MSGHGILLCLHLSVIMEDPAFTNNEIKSRKKSQNQYGIFSSRWGATLGKIDDVFICPPNIILDLFRLLAIPYSWEELTVCSN